MALDVATLGIRVDASGAIQVLDSFGNKVGETQRKAEGLTSTLGGIVAAFGAWKFGEWGKETLMLGARYETLGVVMDVVGRNAGKSAAQMMAYQMTLENTGISGVGARESLAKMAGAQLNLARSADLARVAQNAATIANTNSTEAFERLIEGITTGQPRVLRSLGIFVDFEAGQKKFAQSLNTTAEKLNEGQRLQANMNTAMAGGAQIAGAYKAAMETAGKQLNSTVRYMEDAREKASRAFQPAFTQAVFAYANALKWAGDNAEIVTGAIVGLGGAIVGLGVALKGVSLLTLLNPVALTAAAGIGLLAVTLGTAAANAAIAARDTREYHETLKAMSDSTLEKKLKAINDAISGSQSAPITAREMVELTQKRTDIEAELARRAGETKQHKAQTVPIASELLKKAQEELKAELEKLAFNKSHLTLIGQIAEAKARVQKIEKDAADDAERRLKTEQKIRDLLDGNAGNPKLQGGLTMPKLTTWIGAGNAPGYTNPLGINNTQLTQQEIEIYKIKVAEETALEAKAAKDREQIYQNFLRGMQDSFAQTFLNIADHGIKSFGDILKSLGNLIKQVAAQLAASGVMKWLTKTYNSGASEGGVLGGVGAIAGAIPGVGWIAGGVAAIAGLVTSHHKAAEAAKRQSEENRRLTIEAQRAADAAEALRQAEEAKRRTELLYREEMMANDLAERRARLDGNADLADYIALLRKQREEFTAAVQSGVSEQMLAQLAQIQAAELAALQERQAQAAAAAAQAKIDAELARQKADADKKAAEEQAARDLALWNQQKQEDARIALLRAQGNNAAAAALEYQINLERELADLRKQGASDATIEAVRAAREAQRGAELMDSFAEATRVYNEHLAELTAQTESMAARLADFTQKMGDSIESLAIRLLKAQGMNEEAERRALILQQMQERRQAESEIRSLQAEQAKIRAEMKPNLTSWTDASGQVWQSIQYGVTADEMKQLGAQFSMLQQMIDQQASYVAQLTAVQKAELAAYDAALVKKQAESETQASQQMVDTMHRVADSLRSFSDSLKYGTLSILSPMQQLTEAKRAYDATLSAARGGDATAGANFGSVAQAYLQASRAVNASGGRYAADYTMVQDATAELLSTFGGSLGADPLTASAMVKVNQPIVERLDTNVQVLATGFTDLSAKLTAVASQVAALASATKRAGEEAAVLR